MRNPFRRDRISTLDLARHALEAAASIEDVVEVLRQHARAVAGADGITVVRREGDEVIYIGEDAISPLWTGQRFPLRSCVSGLALLAGEPVVIPNIFNDRRVPLNAYLGTFVKSMAVFPIGRVDPRLAVGIYWREHHPITSAEADRIAALARDAADAVARIAPVDPPRQAA